MARQSSKMFLHEIFFWSAALFLTGVALSSVVVVLPYKLFIALGVIIALTLALRFKTGAWNFLTVFFLTGFIYFHFFNYFHRHASLVFDQKQAFVSIVENSVLTFDGQELLVWPEENSAVIKVITFRHPAFNPGEKIKLTGVVKRTKSAFVEGIMYKPGIEIVEAPENFSFLAFKKRLLVLRTSFQDNLKKVLPYNEAVFLSGLTVGGRSEFSPELKEKFLQSGTSQLIALSGFNIMIIMDYIGGFLTLFFRKKQALWLTTVVIFLFVIMAGAEASLVRAAIMGLVIMVAQQSGRLVYTRNMLIGTALIMTLINPHLLVFDVGFELSFVALLGLIYLKPRLESFLKKDFWGKQSFLTTISAQLAVLPIVFLRFGNFSLSGIIANPLIGFFIPLTMGLGFLTGIIGFVSYHSSLIFAGLAHILLSHELAVISFFAFGG